MRSSEQQLMQRKGHGRRYMVLGHPEDGLYIDTLRRDCLKADERTFTHGKIPVDWFKDRAQLRRDGRKLKQEWLCLVEAREG